MGIKFILECINCFRSSQELPKAEVKQVKQKINMSKIASAPQLQLRQNSLYSDRMKTFHRSKTFSPGYLMSSDSSEDVYSY